MDQLPLSAYIRDAVAFLHMAEACDTDIFVDLETTYRRILKLIIDRYVRAGRYAAIAEKVWLNGQTPAEVAEDYGYCSAQTIRNYLYKIFEELYEIKCDVTEFYELGEEATNVEC